MQQEYKKAGIVHFDLLYPCQEIPGEKAEIVGLYRYQT